MFRDIKALFVCAIIACACSWMLVGCASWMDFNGDGKVDPMVYLDGIDVTVGFVGEDGQIYNLAVDELGKKLLGQFVQVKTGYLFEVMDSGGITITDPDGVSIQIAPKEPDV